jgi:hypothetical protein
MARRISGGVHVKRRPDGGAVLTLKSVTGEAFEIERSAAQVAELVSALSVNPSPPAMPAAEEAAPEPAQKKRGKASKSEETSNA